MNTPIPPTKSILTSTRWKQTKKLKKQDWKHVPQPGIQPGSSSLLRTMTKLSIWRYQIRIWYIQFDNMVIVAVA